MSTSLVLQPGRIGISVNKMQGYLNLMRQRGMIQTALVEDGVYGANMSRAVREAQTYLGLPVDGIIVMTSPQDLVAMIVGKAVKMAQMMNIPVLGVIENYSYVECPDCGKHIEVFGKSRVEEVAAQYGVPVLAKLPIDPKLAEAVDAGQIEDVKLPDSLKGATAMLEKLL